MDIHNTENMSAGESVSDVVDIEGVPANIIEDIQVLVNQGYKILSVHCRLPGKAFVFSLIWFSKLIFVNSFRNG